ncbi:MAG: hypothetical protein LBU25_10540, partial [Treponema sp.]|nr:hypothetical protein [Treponema sp.]
QAVSLIPVPFQWEYAEDATFTKSEEHLSVFAVYRNGSTQKVSLDEIELMLEQTLIDSSPHAFKSPGEKDVALSYGNLSAQYTIIVRSNTETAQGGNGAPVGDTSLTIDIQWK